MDLLRRLPEAIVFAHIFNLLDTKTRIRVAAVCRAWKDLVRDAPTTLGSMPWLCCFQRNCTCFVHPSRKKRKCSVFSSHNPEYCKRYSLVNLSSRRLNIFKSCYNADAFLDDIFGSGVNNLTLVEANESGCVERRLFNPFTRKTFLLPTNYIDENTQMAHPLNHSACFHVSSEYQPDCLVVAWNLHQLRPLCFCRPGDSHWVKGPELKNCISDMIFHNDQFYCINQNYIVAYNVNLNNYHSPSSVVERQIAALPEDWFDLSSLYLVESEGELLLVTRRGYGDKKSFAVYKLEEDKRKLAIVEDLGERMLFVRQGCSISTSGEPPTKDKFFTNNCIYDFDSHYNGTHYFYRLSKFDCRTNSCHSHPSYKFQSWPLWLPPPHPKY